VQTIKSISDITKVDDPKLRQLIQQSVEQQLSQFEPGEYSLEELGFYIVVEAGDTISEMDERLGRSILAPRPELVVDHPGYFEAVFILSDDGLGVTIFSPKQDADPQLLAMCQFYTKPGDTA